MARLSCRHLIRWSAGPLALMILSLGGCTTAAVNPSVDLLNIERPLLVVIDDPRDERRKRGATGPGYSVKTAYQNDPALHRAAQAIADDHGVSIVTEWPLRNLDAHCFVIAQPTKAVLDSLQNDPRVRWVQPLNTFELQTDAKAQQAEVSMADQFLSDIVERGRDVKVAVIDTAIDKTHPDFRRSKITLANFAGSRGQPKSETHGTAVVGIIAAKSQSPRGVTGIANDAQIHVLRGCWQDQNGRGKCNTLTLSLALDAAIDLDADVLNLSVTGPRDRALDELLTMLTKQNTLVVAAYDEQRPPEERFPPQQPGVIYAYGIDNEDNHPMAENILYAPRYALSLAPMKGYDLVSGHSIASPQLSAMAACLIERYPGATRQQIITYLKAWLGKNFVAPASDLMPVNAVSLNRP